MRDQVNNYEIGTGLTTGALAALLKRPPRVTKLFQLRSAIKLAMQSTSARQARWGHGMGLVGVACWARWDEAGDDVGLVWVGWGGLGRGVVGRLVWFIFECTLPSHAVHAAKQAMPRPSQPNSVGGFSGTWPCGTWPWRGGTWPCGTWPWRGGATKMKTKGNTSCRRPLNRSNQRRRCAMSA